MPPIYANGHISATGDPIHFMFGSRVGFSGTADLMALFSIRTNSRWRHNSIYLVLFVNVHCSQPLTNVSKRTVFNIVTCDTSITAIVNKMLLDSELLYTLQLSV